MQNEKCKSCFECTETVIVKVRDDRNSEWRDSSVRRCANDQCWHIVDGTRQDRLAWINNVYDYKYFGDYELSPEQLAAVYEAKSLAALEAALPFLPIAGEGKPVERVRHKKRGTEYTVIARGRLQVDGDLDNEKVVVYRGEDGQVWCRPEYEFKDGRFEALISSPGKDGGQEVEAVAKHLPLRRVDTADYAEIFDRNGEKVALTVRPDLIMALNKISAARWSEDADLDDICDVADAALAAFPDHHASSSLVEALRELLAYTDPYRNGRGTDAEIAARRKAVLALNAFDSSKLLADTQPASTSQEVEAKRWLVEETLSGGSVRWSVFEHEHQAKLEAAKATATVTPLYTRPQPASTALVERGNLACPCTTFQQDEDCEVGYPSLLCTACDGKGITTVDKVVALAAEMMKVAEQVDELEDPFAAWETIDLLKSQNERLTKALSAVNTWAEQRCPCRNEEPNPCPLCGANANKSGDICLSAENTFPRYLLTLIRASLSATSREGESR